MVVSERILIVEDDPNISDVCRRYLERQGYDVLQASDGLAGLDMFYESQPALVILDVMLPKKDGFAVCQEIRDTSDVPIVLLTARGDEQDRLLGLTLGSDDYLTKPFSPRELVLRIQNILRRANPRVTQSSVLEPVVVTASSLVIDPQSRRVSVQDQPVELSAREFDVLWLMATHPGRVYSRMQLLDLIWDSDYEGDVKSVTVLISRLRDKLEVPSGQRWIHTVWGIGYRFEPNGGDSQ